MGNLDCLTDRTADWTDSTARDATEGLPMVWITTLGKASDNPGADSMLQHKDTKDVSEKGKAEKHEGTTDEGSGSRKTRTRTMRAKSTAKHVGSAESSPRRSA